jgi:hypothetical protein
VRALHIMINRVIVGVKKNEKICFSHFDDDFNLD